jgi:3-deoxy-D-manno-octulosonic-acid transferase
VGRFFIKPTSMKTLPALTILVLTITLSTVVGCSTLLSPASPASLPVVTGSATTNDTELVAYLKTAQAANEAFNVTSTAAPINLMLAGAVSLASAWAGWYARHKTATIQQTATLQATTAAAAAAVTAAMTNQTKSPT